MVIPEPYLTIAGAITEAVFSYLLESSGLNRKLREMLGRDPAKLGFKAALGHAIADFHNTHANWYNSLFDTIFFEHEAAPILAQFLLPQGNPDSVALAQLWAESLGNQNPVRIHRLTWECELAAAAFLALLSKQVKERRCPTGNK